MILGLKEQGLSLNSAADRLQSLDWKVTSSLSFSIFVDKNEKPDSVIFRVFLILSFYVLFPYKDPLNVL